MSKDKNFKYKRTILALVAVLLFFLSIVDISLVFHLRKAVMKEIFLDAQREISLMETFAREALILRNYANIEQFLTQWGKEHTDIIELKAIAPNHFVLAHYKRSGPPGKTFNIQHQVQLEGKNLITLIMVKDLAQVEETFRKLIFQLGLRSIFLAIILGFALWYTLKGIALRPLEREIIKRKKAEEEIKRGYLFQSTISEVLKISLEPLSLDVQLEHILKLILTIPWSALQKKGCIFLVEDEPNVLIMKAQQEMGVVAEHCSRVPFGKCLCGEAAEKCEIVFADCLKGSHKRFSEGMFPHGQYCIPICSGDRVHGVLNLVLKEGHKRDKHEDEFLNSIAVTLAGIIDHRKTEQEKERLQNQLIETEKLSALGRMTANVAHEIRNPLTAIGGLTRRLDKKIPTNTKAKEYTKIIIQEAMRLEKILNRVLSFTQKESSHREKCNINEIIDESVKLYEGIYIESGITVERSFADIPHILFDKVKVREVFDNLISNAIEAMPGGGKIRVATGKENINETHYVVVKITDAGKGISREELSQIFEPFFTTKEVGPGHGIGLGLAISKKIMEEQGGFIKAESEVDKGTTIKLFFPFKVW